MTKKLPLWAVVLIGLGLVFICIGLIGIAGADDNVTVTLTPTQTWTPAVPIVEAVPAVNMRPTVVYYGEVVNIWNMIGWANDVGTYQMDYWFHNHSCGYSVADVVIDITKPRAVPVTRATFPYEGEYFQHQLIGEKGCTPVIEVREGKRLSNETDEYMAQQNVTPAVVYDPWPELPDKYSGADVLQARYQPINLTGTGAAWWWLFHGQENIYLLQQANWGNVSSAPYKPGRYEIILQWIGNTSASGVFWYSDLKMVKCACTQVKYGNERAQLAPYLKADLMKALENPACSDDPFETRSMIIEDPSIDVSDVFETINSSEEYTLFVQGYTNLAAGTVINLTIDRKRWDYHNLRSHTFNATVYGDRQDLYRKFRVRIPYDPTELKGGQHTLDAVSPYNTITSVDFWVYELPEGQQRPPAYLKYIDRNLWVPTPTPEVVVQEKIVPGPTQIVTQIVTITPNQSQLNEAAYGAAARVAVDWLLVALEFMAAVAGAYVMSAVVRVYRRGKW